MDLWGILAGIMSRKKQNLSLATEVFDGVRTQMQGILDDPVKLIEFLGVHLKPKQVERQENGEVFTPPSLINEKFDNLEKVCPSIWKDPSRKFLDPANGIGNYPAIAYQRLMNGLEDSIPDAKSRKKHILENMLYMCELTGKNVEVSRKLFDSDDIYKLNIYQGSFFDLDTQKEWGIKSFDVIMGNPPYNSGGIRSSTGNKLVKGKKTETLWPKFVEKSMKLLKNEGYLVFVHPLSWLKTSHSVHDLLLEKCITWLMLWDDSKSKSTIGADIPLSTYIIQNTMNDSQMLTDIKSCLSRQKITMESTVFLDKKYSIPFAYHSIFDKIIKKMEENPTLKLDVRTSTVKSENSGFKLPDTYKVDDMLAIDTYRIKDGYSVKKMKEKHKDTHLPKLIIANKRSFAGSFVDDGRLGLVGSDKFYIVGDNLPSLKKMFDTKLATMISKNVKFRQSFLEKDAILYVPDVRNIPKTELPDVTDEHIYKYLGLTTDEIKLIENN